MSASPRLVLLAALLGSALAPAAEWETVAQGTITVKVRARSGTAIREVWAEGELDVEPLHIQSTILDSESYPTFMPYVKECRFLGDPDPDGSKYVYTRINVPWLSARDYVVKVTTPQRVGPDGGGAFENHWASVPDKVPARSNIVRLKTNEGSWLVTPKDGGKSHVVYKFTVDPGGFIPGFAANMGNKSGVTDTFKAVEKEARRRRGMELEAKASPPPPQGQK